MLSDPCSQTGVSTDAQIDTAKPRAVTPIDTEHVDNAIADLIEPNLPALTGYAMKLTGRHDLACDMVQQTCLRAWTCRQTYDPSKSGRAWLFTILRNEYLQHIRRELPLTNNNDSVFEASDGKNDITATQYEAKRLIESIEALPEKQREAITLVVVLGYSYDEAGKAAGCAPGTIKSRVNRGKEALQHAIG